MARRNVLKRGASGRKGLRRAARSKLARRRRRPSPWRKRPPWWWKRKRYGYPYSYWYPYRRTRTVYVLPSVRRAEGVISPSLSSAAKASLKRQGLYTLLWQTRLQTARRPLRRFINRFHNVPGFALVVRAAYGDTRRRRLAKLAIRAANQLGQHVAERRGLRFEASLGLTPEAKVVPTLDLVDIKREERYRLLPWTRVSLAPLLRLIRSDTTLHPTPLTYLFDADTVTLSGQALLRRVRRAWTRRYGGVRLSSKVRTKAI